MDDSDFIAIGNAVYNDPAYYNNTDIWNNPEYLNMNIGVGMIAQSSTSITIKAEEDNNVKDLHVAVIGGIN